MTKDTENIKDAIVVYGASSEEISLNYKKAAQEVGQLIAESRHALVCGGGRAGLMKAAIDGALQCGGTAIGVLPQFMIDNNWHHPELTHMISTPDMHSRKQTMASMSCAAIACPGGCGTFEELFEIITWRQLNLFHGQVVILNTDGYYNSIIEMFERAIAEGFMHADHRNLFTVANTPEEAVKAALEPAPAHLFSQKIH